MNKVIISGGGTGGHIYPAIAIADALVALNKNVEILFVGAEGKMEMDKVPQAGYKIEGLPIAGFQRRLTSKNLMFPIKLLRSMRKARSIVKEFKPDIAIGVGGYASGPILRVASRMGIKTLLQEQNSYPGITNRILSKSASSICVAYEGMDKFFPAQKIRFTGNPVRQDINYLGGKRDEGYKFFGLDPNKKTVLVMGGRVGAKTLNDALTNAFDLISANSDIQWIWQSGSFYKGLYDHSPLAMLPNVVNMSFIERVDLAYACADLVIGRAGALTVSEICVAGKPSILIPSPNVTEDHQTKNAMSLVRRNAALMLSDMDAPKQLVIKTIACVQNKEELDSLAANALSLAKPNAANEIAREIMELIGHNISNN